MTHTIFQTSDKQLKAASQLSVGDQILDSQGSPVFVKWKQLHGKEKRLLVDLYTKQSMLTVTGSHRVETPDRGTVQAKELKKSDLVLVAYLGVQDLQKVTKRNAHVQVVELEFDGDATVPVYVPTILTKGSALDVGNINSGDPECKEELVEGNSMVCITTSSLVKNGPRTDSDSDGIPSTKPAEGWLTDDGF